jgi:hypothetical protein
MFFLNFNSNNTSIDQSSFENRVLNLNSLPNIILLGILIVYYIFSAFSRSLFFFTTDNMDMNMNQDMNTNLVSLVITKEERRAKNSRYYNNSYINPHVSTNNVDNTDHTNAVSLYVDPDETIDKSDYYRTFTLMESYSLEKQREFRCAYSSHFSQIKYKNKQNKNSKKKSQSSISNVSSPLPSYSLPSVGPLSPLLSGTSFSPLLSGSPLSPLLNGISPLLSSTPSLTSRSSPSPTFIRSHHSSSPSPLPSLKEAMTVYLTFADQIQLFNTQLSHILATETIRQIRPEKSLNDLYKQRGMNS